MAEVVDLLKQVGFRTFLDECAAQRQLKVTVFPDQVDVFASAFPSVEVCVGQNIEEADPKGLLVDATSLDSAPAEGSCLNFFRDLVPAFICRNIGLDRRPATGPRYYILSTPRSGSTFLCDLLTSTSALGSPTEHLKPWIAQYLRLTGMSVAQLLDGLHSFASTPNAVFGSKIIIDDLFSFFPDFLNDFIAEFGKSHVFLLLRGDKGAQAISNLRATRLSLYHVTQGDEAIKELARTSLVVEPAEVFMMERWLLRQEADLINILREHRIGFEGLSYENLSQSRLLTEVLVGNIGRSVGVTEILALAWPNLVRIGSVVSPEAQLRYGEFRANTALYSARSEPSLREILLEGWNEVENWGVVTADRVARLRIPPGRRWHSFEILIDMTPQSPAEITIGGVCRPLFKAQGRGQIRWLGRVSEEMLAGSEVRLDVGEGPVSIEEVAFYAGSSFSLKDSSENAVLINT